MARRRPAKKQPSRSRRFFIAGAIVALTGIFLLARARFASPPPVTTTPPTSPVAAATSPVPTPVAQGAIRYSYRVKAVLPHDRRAFTQGLVFEDGIFYEGTGLYARSSLRKVTPETGAVLQQENLAPNLFGEGITVWGDKIIQLTWKARKGFVYDKNTFERLKTFSYPTEGWGITHDDTRLIMSDGTATLYFWDPETLAEIGKITVTDGGAPVVRLNELEYINGEIYANIWQTNRIARINPNTGQVTGWIDLTGLLSAEDIAEPVDVLNGIAFDADNNRLFVTGKLWPKIFEIELVAQ